MKLLIYSLNYAPEPTSTGKYTGEMAAWLAARGHDVEAIAGLPHYPRWKLDERYAAGRLRNEWLEGVQVRRVSHSIPGSQSVNACSRILMETSFTLSAARYWLLKLFSSRRPDVVIAVMPPLQIGVWPLLYAWVRRVPWVLHVQDLQVDAALRLNLLKVGPLAWFLYRIESFLLRQATRVSTITESMRVRVVSKGGRDSRAWLFPNWADISFVRPLERDNAFRAGLGLAREDRLVLHAGNMGEKQGLDVVLDAAECLRGQAHIHFLLVGHGAARARLEARAKALGLANLRFLPVQPWKVLPEMLAAGDIHLVVQRQDVADLVMPSKLTNILAAGRPCVVTAKSGTALAEVVQGHGAGLTVPSEDPQALANAISRLAEDEALCMQYGRNARRYAEEFLDREAILSRFEQRLETLVRVRGQA